jgi:hypothetical protein
MEIVLAASALFLGAFGVQGLLLHLTWPRFRIVSFLPLLAVAGLWYTAWQHYTTPSFFHLHCLIAFIYGCSGCLILLGLGLGWIVFGRKR